MATKDIIPKYEQSIISFDKVKEKFKCSTATVEEMRYAIFAPIERVSYNSKASIEMRKNKNIQKKTNWGTFKIKNRILTQTHRDLLDCILTYGELLESDHENYIGYKFSLNQMLNKFYGKKTRNTKIITDLIEDLLSALILIEPNNGDHAKFSILSFGGYLKELDSYYIKFNPDYVNFFFNSLTINYKEYLDDIIHIKEPIIKAIIRLALTQKDTLTLKIYDKDAEKGKTGILEAIGETIENESQKKRAFKILRDNAHILEKYGVYYEPGVNKIRYRKNRNIKFIPARLNQMIQEKSNEEKDIFFQLENYKNKTFILNDKNYSIEDIILNEQNKDISVAMKELDTNTVKIIPLPLVEKSKDFLDDLINGKIKANTNE